MVVESPIRPINGRASLTGRKRPPSPVLPSVQSTERASVRAVDCVRYTFIADLTVTMISRSSLGRHAQLIVQKQCCASPSNRRGLAAAASGTFQYKTGDAAGVKFATRDLAGPTTTLAVVAKAGTRYQILPGFTEGLEKFAFKVRWLQTFPLRLGRRRCCIEYGHPH